MTFYAVAKGLHPGIYDNWLTAEAEVVGYPGAVYKGFPTQELAQAFMNQHDSVIVPSTLDTLTEEQRRVLDHLLNGENVFLTGGGGVGKSYLLSVIYTEFPGLMRSLSQRSSRIQICALTGCAALLLGHKAKTIHSWAGIGLGKGTVGELYVKIRRNQKAMRKWLCTELLIIDEVSMMTAELLDKLNELGKKIRGSSKPFGGIQVLLVGDFYQLPPVNRSDDATMFAFDSAAWREAITCTVELTEIQRQKDPVFQGVLKEARAGCLSKDSCAILRTREGLDWKDNKIKPTPAMRASCALLATSRVVLVAKCRLTGEGRSSSSSSSSAPKRSDRLFLRLDEVCLHFLFRRGSRLCERSDPLSSLSSEKDSSSSSSSPSACLVGVRALFLRVFVVFVDF